MHVQTCPPSMLVNLYVVLLGDDDDDDDAAAAAAAFSDRDRDVKSRYVLWRDQNELHSSTLKAFMPPSSSTLNEEVEQLQLKDIMRAYDLLNGSTRSLFHTDQNALTSSEQASYSWMPQYRYYRLCRQQIFGASGAGFAADLNVDRYLTARVDYDKYAVPLACELWFARNAAAVALNSVKMSQADVVRDMLEFCTNHSLPFIPIKWSEALARVTGFEGDFPVSATQLRDIEPPIIRQYREKVVRPLMTHPDVLRYMYLVRQDAEAAHYVLATGLFVSSSVPVPARVAMDKPDFVLDRKDVRYQAEMRRMINYITENVLMSDDESPSAPKPSSPKPVLKPVAGRVSRRIQVEEEEEQQQQDEAFGKYTPAATAAPYAARAPPFDTNKVISRWESDAIAYNDLRAIIGEVSTDLLSMGKAVNPMTLDGPMATMVRNVPNFVNMYRMFVSQVNRFWGLQVAPESRGVIFQVSKSMHSDQELREVLQGDMDWDDYSYNARLRMIELENAYCQLCQTTGLRFDVWFANVLLRVFHMVQFVQKFVLIVNTDRPQDTIPVITERGGIEATLIMYHKYYSLVLLSYTGVDAQAAPSLVSRIGRNMWRGLRLMTGALNPTNYDYIDPTFDQFGFLWMGMFSAVPRSLPSLSTSLVQNAGVAQVKALWDTFARRSGQAYAAFMDMPASSSLSSTTTLDSSNAGQIPTQPPPPPTQTPAEPPFEAAVYKIYAKQTAASCELRGEIGTRKVYCSSLSGAVVRGSADIEVKYHGQSEFQRLLSLPYSRVYQWTKLTIYGDNGSRQQISRDEPFEFPVEQRAVFSAAELEKLEAEFDVEKVAPIYDADGQEYASQSSQQQQQQQTSQPGRTTTASPTQTSDHMQWFHVATGVMLTLVGSAIRVAGTRQTYETPGWRNTSHASVWNELQETLVNPETIAYLRTPSPFSALTPQTLARKRARVVITNVVNQAVIVTGAAVMSGIDIPLFGGISMGTAMQAFMMMAAFNMFARRAGNIASATGYMLGCLVILNMFITGFLGGVTAGFSRAANALFQ
jgi:hypothetical protein